MDCKKQDVLLYGITDRKCLHGHTLYEQVEAALKGGVTFLQLREKGMEEEKYIQEAMEIKALCDQYQVPLIINDRADIARKVDAAGVHVGQKDMEAEEARKILGPDKIVGVSARTVEQAMEAERQGADYLGSGAVFPTGTKTDAQKLDWEVLKQITESVNIPVVAIGGICLENIEQLQGTGISGVAVASGIFGQKDVEDTARKMKDKVKKTMCE